VDKQQKAALIIMPIVAIGILAGGMFMSNKGATASAATYTDGVYEGVGEGFAGPIKVKVEVAGGKIASIDLLEHSETPGIGDVGAQNVIDSIIAEQKADVDVSSGATFSSNGVMEAVKNALSAAGGTQSFTDGEFEGTGEGFGGPIKVKVVVSGGKITGIELLENSETPGLGDVGAQNVIDSIIAEQKTDVDVSSGATFSSNGVMEAVKNALAGGTAGAKEEPAEEAVEEVEFIDGVYEGAAEGFHGDIKVKVEVKDGKLVSIEVLEHGETEGLGDVALTELSNAMIEKQTVAVDGKTGATYSSKGIQAAVINALKSEAMATAEATDKKAEEVKVEDKKEEAKEEPKKEESKKEEPKKEEAKPAEPAKADGFKDGTYVGKAEGFYGNIEMKVTIAGGKISDVTINKMDETEGIGDVAVKKIAENAKAKNTGNLDTISGATVSSTGAITAIKNALSQAK